MEILKLKVLDFRRININFNGSILDFQKLIFDLNYTLCERFFKVISWLVYLSLLNFVFIKTNLMPVKFLFESGELLFFAYIFFAVDYFIFRSMLIFNFKWIYFSIITFIWIILEYSFIYRYLYKDIMEIIKVLSIKYS